MKTLKSKETYCSHIYSDGKKWLLLKYSWQISNLCSSSDSSSSSRMSPPPPRYFNSKSESYEAKSNVSYLKRLSELYNGLSTCQNALCDKLCHRSNAHYGRKKERLRVQCMWGIKNIPPWKRQGLGFPIFALRNIMNQSSKDASLWWTLTFQLYDMM